MIQNGHTVLVKNSPIAKVGVVAQVCHDDGGYFYHVKSLNGDYLGIFNSSEVFSLTDAAEELFARLDGLDGKPLEQKAAIERSFVVLLSR